MSSLLGTMAKHAGALLTDLGRSTAKAQPRQTGRRRFDAAQPTRAATNWGRADTALNRDIRAALPALRSRSRDLVKNSALGSRFVHMTQTNVVGADGVKLQMQVTQPGPNNTQVPDKNANQVIEEAWKTWCRKEFCTIDGRWAFEDVQMMAMGAEETDGDFFVRHIRGADNPFGYSVQMIDAVLLDITKEQDRYGAQNRIEMGIEMDPYDRPVAYWFRKKNMYMTSFEHVRVPADEIVHFYMPRSGVDQIRGYPAMTPVMINIKQLDGYYNAEIMAARMGAAKAGFFETPTGEDWQGPPADATADAEGGRTMEVEPGVFEELPLGWKFTPYDPTHPTTAFPDFVKAIKRDFASGVNRSYNALASDLEGVNFSSMRAGVLEDRESYKWLQRVLVTHVISPIFTEWLKAAMLSGAVALPLSKFAKFNKPKWHARRWGWVDPLKDIEAVQAELASGLTSHAKVLAEAGEDLAETWAELADEKKKAEALNIQPLAFNPVPKPPVVAKVEV